ncbi:MAG: hypothetical protein PF444_03085 [Bacteroidales bacterium]|jgi:hypothetical protein|nr:hypothetical protein [Bacteroidales bacterium]
MNIEHLKQKGVDANKILSLLSINALLPDVIEANAIEIQDKLYCARVYINTDKKRLTRLKRAASLMVDDVMKQLGSEEKEAHHAKDSDSMKDLIELLYQLDDEAIIKAKSTLKTLIKKQNPINS